MFKFYDREKEKEALDEILKKSKKTCRFTFILGSRRVGKTSLITNSYLDNTKYQDETFFYLFISRKTEKLLLQEFLLEFKRKIEDFPTFDSLESFFEYIFIYCKKNHITLILDEFQNFDYVDKSIYSILQKLYDKYHKQSHLNLIVIGSIYSSMEKIFSNKHEPLFGRTTGRMEIKPLNVKHLYDICSDYSKPTLNRVLDFYTLFGTIPKYYELLYQEDLFHKKIEKIFYELFIAPNAKLRMEGRDLLIEEFGPDYQRYFSILEAISNFKNISNQKISSYIGVNNEDLSSYLFRLEKTFGVISKDHSVINMARKGRYKIKNYALRTWFRFIYQNQSELERGNIDYIMKDFKNNFNSIKGYAFEDLVQQVIFNRYDIFPHSTWTKFWDKNIEIDLLGLEKKEKKAVLIECKFKVTKDTLLEVDKKEEYLKNKYLKNYKIEKVLFELEEKTKVSNPSIKIYSGSEILDMLKSLPKHSQKF